MSKKHATALPRHLNRSRLHPDWRSFGSDIKAEVSKIPTKVYEKELAKLQIELVKLQEWVKTKGLKVVVVFEGRDAAGKGGTIKRITEPLNPRVCRVVASGDSDRTRKDPVVFPALCAASALRPARSCCSTAAGTTAPASSM